MQGFIDISKFAGMREDLAQAGGGNSSWKETPEKMYIKASGYQLADVCEEEGYAIVNPSVIREAFLSCDNLDAMTEEDSKAILDKAFIEGKRPSIETFLHSISGEFTLHTHATMADVFACRKGGMEELEEMFPEALFIPYAKPGVELAKVYFKAYKAKGIDAPKVVFMANHGLVVSGDSAEEVINGTDEIVKKLADKLGIDIDSYLNATQLWQTFKNKVVWRVNDETVLFTYRKIGVWDSAFTPDNVCFLGKKFFSINDKIDTKVLDEFLDAYGEPKVIEYKQHLYIIADSVRKALEIQSVLSFSATVASINSENVLLTNTQQDELLNWDAEKYRQQFK